MSFSSSAYYFDDLEVGNEWTSGGRAVTEADIVNFAGFSGDFNPIHMDHEFCKTTPFRRPILTYSDDGRSFLDRLWCIEAVTMPSTCFPAGITVVESPVR